MTQKLYRVIGLMSGTSMDGVDAALIETDGRDLVTPLAFHAMPYAADFRQKLRACLGNLAGSQDPAVAVVERELTELHARSVFELLRETSFASHGIDFIGFHGQTLWHRPEAKQTCQIGDGALLAQLTGISVVNDFRTADMQAGGQGAPLVPLYHQALAAGMPKPLAILNIGGVANVTWLGAEGGVFAFDSGPGNALVDDWVWRHTGARCDEDGRLASRGRIDWQHIEKFKKHPYFFTRPPKSLDRDAFASCMVDGLSLEDGAATLTMMSVAAIQVGLNLFCHKIPRLLVTGGGRLNRTMMDWLAVHLSAEVAPVESVGWNGDALEAEAFAWLAVRSVLGLHLSLPTTTGVRGSVSGGRVFEAGSQNGKPK